MSNARFRRPDGKFGTFGQWASEKAAQWAALSAKEQAESRAAAAARMRNSAPAGDGPAVLRIFDEIGWFGVWPDDVAAALDGLAGRDVEVHVNSPGGSVFDGLAIYNTLREHSGGVGVVIDGLAASAASFIAMAASPGKLEIAENGVSMIHEAFGLCIGDAAEMTAMAGLLDESSANIASIYASRGNRTAPEYRDLMRAETWAVGSRAVELGLADKVRAVKGDDAGDAAASLPWAVEIYAGPDERTRAMEQALYHISVEATSPAVSDEWARREIVRHLTEAGLSNADVDNSDWDASRAWANGAASDDPAKFYDGICAGKKAGDPATQAAHALPYRYTPSSPPNANGVANALTRLPQTEGLTNAGEAKALLQRLMKQINPDYEPDDKADWLTSLMEGTLL